MQSVRLHVGGLPENVRDDELATRFKPFGTVLGVELALANTPGASGCRGFGYVDLLSSEEQVQRCIKTYKGTRWRGRQLSIEPARPHYLKWLQAPAYRSCSRSLQVCLLLLSRLGLGG